MQPEPIATQEEARTSAVAVRVTASEKRAVVLVAAAREITESECMRTMTIDQIVAEAGHVRANLPGREDAA